MCSVLEQRASCLYNRAGSPARRAGTTWAQSLVGMLEGAGEGMG